MSVDRYYNSWIETSTTLAETEDSSSNTTVTATTTTAPEKKADMLETESLNIERNAPPAVSAPLLYPPSLTSLPFLCHVSLSYFASLRIINTFRSAVLLAGVLLQGVTTPPSAHLTRVVMMTRQMISSVLHSCESDGVVSIVADKQPHVCRRVTVCLMSRDCTSDVT